MIACLQNAFYNSTLILPLALTALTQQRAQLTLQTYLGREFNIPKPF